MIKKDYDVILLRGDPHTPDISTRYYKLLQGDNRWFLLFRLYNNYETAFSWVLLTEHTALPINKQFILKDLRVIAKPILTIKCSEESIRQLTSNNDLTYKEFLSELYNATGDQVFNYFYKQHNADVLLKNELDNNFALNEARKEYELNFVKDLIISCGAKERIVNLLKSKVGKHKILCLYPTPIRDFSGYDRAPVSTLIYTVTTSAASKNKKKIIIQYACTQGDYRRKGLASFLLESLIKSNEQLIICAKTSIHSISGNALMASLKFTQSVYKESINWVRETKNGHTSKM